MGKYRLLHIDTEEKLGGGEKQLAYLVSNLNPLLFDSVVVVRDSEEIRRFFGGAIYVDFSNFFKALRTLVHVVRDLSVDIVHAHTGLAATYAALLKPFVCGVLATRRVSIPVRNPLSRVKYNLMDRVVIVSRPLMRYVSFMNRNKVEWVESALSGKFWHCPNRDEAMNFLKLDTSRRYVCGVGKLDRMKGFDCLIKAMSMVPEADLILAGSGDMGYLRGVASKCGVLDRVHFLGFVDDTRYVYAASELCVVSSVFGEGSSAVIKEALACGIPVVATDVGGARDILGDNGAIVPPGDEHALAEAMSNILSNGIYLSFDKERFSPVEMARKYEAIYTAIMKEKSCADIVR